MSGRQDERGGSSLAERTTLAISVAILLAIVGLTTWLHVAGGTHPAVITAVPQLETMRQEGEVWYLPVSITNDGDTTVQDVIVEAELTSGSGEPETAEITIMYLADGATSEGTFIFRSDPSRGDLTVQAISYTVP